MGACPATSTTRSSTRTTSWRRRRWRSSSRPPRRIKPTSYLETGSATTRTRTSSSRRTTSGDELAPSRRGLHRTVTTSVASVARALAPLRGGLPRTNDVKFPTGDHFFEDAFHWRAPTAAKDVKVAYTGTPVVAHTVGDARQTTAGIDGADAEKLGGYFPNLNAIAALLADKPLRSYSRVRQLPQRQVDRLAAAGPKARAKFARIYKEPRLRGRGRDLRAEEDLLSEFDDNDHVKFFARRGACGRIIRRDPDQGRRQADHGPPHVAHERAAATEVFVVDDGSTDDTVEAVQKFRGTTTTSTCPRPPPRARGALATARPLREGAFTVYVTPTI